jgi:hypothetical protein
MNKKSSFFYLLMIVQILLVLFNLSNWKNADWVIIFTPFWIILAGFTAAVLVEFAPLLLKSNRVRLQKYYAAKDLKLTPAQKLKYGFTRDDRYYNFLAGQWMDINDHKNFLNITYDIKVRNPQRMDIEFSRFNYENGYFIGPVPPASVRVYETIKFLPEQVKSFRAHEAVPKEVIDILRNIELEEARVAYQQSK